MPDRVRQLIDHYGLQPLPVEGTLYTNTYRSGSDLGAGQPVATAMVGLLSTAPRSVSMFHRLRSDEIWHFYEGDPIMLILLHAGGGCERVVLGADEKEHHRRQFVVPAGTWQAATVAGGGTYSLFACTMAPGFMGSHFEAAHSEDLLTQYPDCATEIASLCVPPGETTSMPQSFMQ